MKQFRISLLVLAVVTSSEYSAYATHQAPFSQPISHGEAAVRGAITGGVALGMASLARVIHEIAIKGTPARGSLDVLSRNGGSAVTQWAVPLALVCAGVNAVSSSHEFEQGRWNRFNMSSYTAAGIATFVLYSSYVAN